MPAPPRYQAPAELTQKVLRGEGVYPQDFDALERWRQASGPGWLPKAGFDLESAAALSQLRDGPRSWAHVDLYPSPAPGEDPWTMVVHYKRGYPQTIEIPGGAHDGQPAKEVIELLEHPEHFGVGNAWGDWNPDDLDIHES